MAIKAIINNTEKEIEQIKNSDEQDIDYVYSRIGDTEVEGEPPISIKSIGGNLADYRIYGNTVGGESVGDRTGNLFDEKQQMTTGVITNDGAIDNTESSCEYSDFIEMLPNVDYTIRATYSTQKYIRVVFYDSSKNFIERVLSTSITPTITFNKNANYIRICVDKGWSTIMLNAGSTPLPYEPYGYKVPVTVSNGTDTLTTPIYLPEQIKKVGDEVEYIDYGEQKMHRIGADDVDVTLPALSTIKGTNTLSVSTSIQPSNIYIKDGFDYKRVFTATRAIEDELPLNYRNIEDNDSTLDNYRIYGNTVGGESVGDLVESGEHAGEYEVPVTVEGKNLVTSYLVEPNGGMQFHPVVFAEVNLQPNTEYLITFTVHENGVKLYSNDLLFTSVYYSSEIQGKKTMRLKTKTSIRLDQHIDNKGWVLLRNAKQNPSDFTITDVKLQLVSDAPIYLPEPIRKVGDEAEYIDYGEQKQHRVRKNLLPNTATSQTNNGVTFTVNSDGSVTCNGTATNIIEVGVFLDFLLPPGNYRLTGCPPGGWSSYPDGKVSYCLRAWYAISGNVTWLFDYGDGCNFTLTDTKRMRSSIVIEKAQVVDNITFYPMIRKADIEDDTYEPYIENTELDVTLPALPTLTGTNVLSVGTAVQPSEVYVKGKIKEIN